MGDGGGVDTLTLPRGTTDQVIDRVFPEASKYTNDPEIWVEERLDEFIWSKQREILRSVRDNRYTAVKSAHDTGKSYTASRAAAWWIDAHPPGEAFVVSTAPSQNQVEAILWREIGRAHRRGGLRGRITAGMVPQWKFGQEIVGYGRKPQDLVSKEEAMTSFQGIHAKWVLIVLDEAGGIPKWLWDAVDSLATNQYARVLAIGNPDDPATHFEEVCRPGSGWNTLKISAFDTPAFTGEDVPQYLLDVLVSKEWVDEREKRWGKDSNLYISKVLGEFPDVSENTLLSPRLIREAQGRDLSGAAIKTVGRYGADIARSGDDETAIYRNRAGMIRQVEIRRKQNTMKTADMIYLIVEPHKGAAPVNVDVIGIGAGVLDRLQQRDQPAYEFNASSQAFRPDKFLNRRAEAWWAFREGIEDGEIDLPPDGEDDDLIAQLGAVRWEITQAGKIKIESKDDMVKRGLPSPDRADAAVMAYVAPADFILPDRYARGNIRTHAPETGDLMRREL